MRYMEFVLMVCEGNKGHQMFWVMQEEMPKVKTCMAQHEEVPWNRMKPVEDKLIISSTDIFNRQSPTHQGGMVTGELMLGWYALPTEVYSKYNAARL